MQNFKEMSSKLGKVSKEDILHCLRLIPSYLRPQYNTRSVRSCRNALLHHIRDRILYLASLSNDIFFHNFLSVLPFDIDHYNSSRSVLTERILYVEYGDIIISSLRTKLLSFNEIRRDQRRQIRDDFVTEDMKRMQDICSIWPTVVPDNVVFECLANYREHTIWHQPSICCVCGLKCMNVVEINLFNKSECPIDFSILHVKDSFVSDLEDFQYGSYVINNCVLDKAGFKQNNEDGIIIQICNDCYSALKHNRLPRLSLANYLYRGKLPDEFNDLTWVEEMVCAKYRNTAHVSRIYESSDPSQPKVFHGNTCAHEMNLLSTASVLPRTITDINDMLMIVFVGPGKFDPNSLAQMFTIRKKSVEISFMVVFT